LNWDDRYDFQSMKNFQLIINIYKYKICIDEVGEFEVFEIIGWWIKLDYYGIVGNQRCWIKFK
jgi:hypothetical protein